MNKQRTIIYAQRREVLDGEDLKDNIIAMIEDVAEATVSSFVSDETSDLEALKQEVYNVFGIEELDSFKDKKLDYAKVKAELVKKAEEIYQDKCDKFGETF